MRRGVSAGFVCSTAWSWSFAAMRVRPVAGVVAGTDGSVSTVVVVGLALWARKATKLLLTLGTGMIIGGAIGNNLIDRVMYGYVVDFIQVHYAGWYFPSFNVADSAITVGAALLILDEILRVRRS